MYAHHAHVWRRTLRWPSWLLFSPPARPASALSHPELFWHGQDLPQLLMLPPSCLPCCLGQGCVAPGYETPYLQLFHQLAETEIDIADGVLKNPFIFQVNSNWLRELSLSERTPIMQWSFKSEILTFILIIIHETYNSEAWQVGLMINYRCSKQEYFKYSNGSTYFILLWGCKKTSCSTKRHSVLTEVLSVQRLSSSPKKAFEEAPVWSLRCLHWGK